MIRRPPRPTRPTTRVPHTTLFRALLSCRHGRDDDRRAAGGFPDGAGILGADRVLARVVVAAEIGGQADERAPHAARAFSLYRQVKLQETLTADPSCHGATQLLAVIIEG